MDVKTAARFRRQCLKRYTGSKMLRNLLVLYAVIFMTSACVTTTQQNQNVVTTYKPELTEDKKALRESFIGKWLSSQPTKDGGTRRALIERLPDSRYVVEFNIYDAKGTLIETQREFGFWGVSGGIYFTIYRGWIENDQFYQADPNDAYNYDSYKIISTAENKLEYQSLSSGNLFIYTREK